MDEGAQILELARNAEHVSCQFRTKHCNRQGCR
jgi:hypothetical protein